MDGKGMELGGEGISTKKQEKSETRATSLLTWFRRGIPFVLWGYLLGGAVLPFGSTPLGVALLAAADGRAIFALTGLLLGAALGKDGIFLAALYLALVFLRILCRLVLDLPDGAKGSEATLGDLLPHLFREHMGLRVANAAVGAFAIGLRRWMTGGMLYYDLYGAILSTVAAPAATLLLLGLFRQTREERGYWVGALSLCAAVTFSLRGESVYGISLGVLAALTGALLLAYRKGVMLGAVGGAILGLCASPSLLPLFVFCGLLAGLIFPHAPTLGIAASFCGGLGWSYYTLGLGFLNGVLGALLASHLLFWVWLRFFERGEKAAEEPALACVKSPSDGYAERMRFFDVAARIHSLSVGLSALGNRLDDMAKEMQRPDRGALRALGERAFDGACTSCPQKEVCFGERYGETSADMEELFFVLGERGEIRREDAPRLGERCARLPDLLEEINQNASRYASELLASDRAELMATDLCALSGLLASVMAEGDGEYATDRDATERLAHALGDGVGVLAVGGRRRRVGCFGEDVTDPTQQERLRAQAEEILGCLFEVERADKEEGILVLAEKPRLKVHSAMRRAPASGESEICGDTVKAFLGGDGRFYGLISDGMGAGATASATSESAGIFLEALLRAGGDRRETLKLLNEFLRSRGSGGLRECSATVDLFEYDLLRGRALFYKSGAAPTYVMRKGGVFKLRARTLPMGIIRSADVSETDLSLDEGDTVVMISDGVTQGREECPRLFDLLHSHADTTDVERLADLILKYAKEERSEDDVSVLVMRIERDAP